MAYLRRNTALTFDDVLISPSFSQINSRSTIDISQSFLGKIFNLPIISANMDFITEESMANAMWANGGLGILHRFSNFDKQLEWIHSKNDFPKVISVGIRDFSETLGRISEVKEQINAICIDVAHGDSQNVVDLIKIIADKYSYLPIIAGNVATSTGFLRLSGAGAYAVKVGIGPGSICTTRTVTGVGYPQLSAIMDINQVARQRNSPTKIIADGGIKNSGDIVKALAAGADFVMLGHLLAGHDECPGDIIVGQNGRKYKPYRGQSIFGSNGLRFTPEGVSGYVEYKGPVADTLRRLAGGIRSGMSYVGATTLEELRDSTEFIQVSGGTMIETQTRVMMEI